jgi:putative ABC transport system ATP-binding protein
VGELSIEENVELPLRLKASDPRRRADLAPLFELLGLDALKGRLPDEASLGEQQRAAVARALVVQPAVLLADEPVGHQDEGWTKVVMQAIRDAASEGTGCLIATHDPETWSFLDRILKLHDGVVG